MRFGCPTSGAHYFVGASSRCHGATKRDTAICATTSWTGHHLEASLGSLWAMGQHRGIAIDEVLHMTGLAPCDEQASVCARLTSQDEIQFPMPTEGTG